MKTVFKSDEIAHIWANNRTNGATEGRVTKSAYMFGGHGARMSFSGDAFYSYDTVIANRVKAGKKFAYVIDDANFGPTTRKHQYAVRGAIKGADKVFTVHCGKRHQTLCMTPADLVKHFVNRAEEQSAEMPSRYAHKRAEQFAHVTSLYQSALDVCLYFGLGHKTLDKTLAKRAEQMAAGADVLKVHREKLLELERTKDAREHAARAKRNIEQAEKYLAGEMTPLAYVDLAEKATALATLPDDLRARFIAAAERNNAALVAKWQAGEDVRLPHDSATLLRAEDSEMVTTKGARVPLSDAKRTYRFVCAKRLKGWHRNGEQHSIGAYALEAVNDSGVIVGCHRVTWAEIERFATSQGWSSAA